MFDIDSLKGFCDERLYQHICSYYEIDVLQAVTNFAYIDHGENLAKSALLKYKSGGISYYAYYPGDDDTEDGLSETFDRVYFSPQEVVAFKNIGGVIND